MPRRSAALILMRTHIDWLTFTMTMQYGAATALASDFAAEYAIAIEQAFLMTFGADLTAKIFGGEWEKNERSRAPYTDAWKMADGNITLFASPTLSHCCVEVSGKGCEAVIASGDMDTLLSQIADRVTRIDVACDIETEIRPTAFVKDMAHERMRASGYQKSETGETCYIGSQKSDRYARVYRYEKPHPRSNLLRVEHVFRRYYAKVLAKEYTAHSLEAIAQSCGKAFGWAHAVWDVKASDSVDLSTVSLDRQSGTTINWIINSAASAFKRLCADGTIRDPRQFIEQYFLSEM